MSGDAVVGAGYMQGYDPSMGGYCGPDGNPLMNPPNMVAGVTAPQYGMTYSGTPIGLLVLHTFIRCTSWITVTCDEESHSHEHPWSSGRHEDPRAIGTRSILSDTAKPDALSRAKHPFRISFWPSSNGTS